MVSNLQNAVALDFDWSQQMIYWSDVTSAGSNISRMTIDGKRKEVNKLNILKQKTYQLKKEYIDSKAQ